MPEPGIIDDAEDIVTRAAKKLKAKATEAAQVVPSPKDFKNGLSAASSGLDAMRSMQSDNPTVVPSTYDIIAGLNSGIAQAKGYYRGYIQPKIESAWRDLQKKFQ
jgi:hypothetical protein